jgi:hypothetical protein
LKLAQQDVDRQWRVYSTQAGTVCETSLANAESLPPSSPTKSASGDIK